METKSGPATKSKTAKLYRMETDQHICPWGLRSRHLLRREGFTIEDNILTSREEADTFKQEHDVKTTPQTFINGARVGGYEDLRRFFGKKIKDKQETSYWPVMTAFLTAFILSLGVSFLIGNPFDILVITQRFVAIAMVLLAMLKLQDIDKFVTMFIGYDMLAKRSLGYGYFYPLAEFGAGALMLCGLLTWLAAPVALVIGSIGAVSVFKAVYIDRRTLKCACVGGDSNVPLGFVSLTENVVMVALSIWMLIEFGMPA